MFHFDDLSPLDFEHLVGDLLERELGVAFQTFKDGRDGGIDLRAVIAGRKVFVQAKRFIHTSFSGLKTACKKEALAWTKRKTQPDVYWLATSLRLSYDQKTELVSVLTSLPISTDRIIGNESLQKRLKDNPDIVRSHMKLWLNESATLDNFLKSDLYEHTQFTTDNIRSSMRTYVEHGGLGKARAIIEGEGSVVISGAPGIGKSTLANMLLLQHIDEGWTPMIITDPKDGLRAVKKGERRIIYFDDFLGSTKLTNDRLGKSEAPITALLDRAKNDEEFRFILTSRDYILSQAAQSSDRLSDDFLRQKKYLLQLPEYTNIQKAKILYNHVFFSEMPKEHRKELLKWGFCNTIITHPNFNPRLIMTMTGKLGTDSAAESYRDRFKKVLDKPDILWKVPFYEHFDPSDQLLVLTIATYQGSIFNRLSILECLERFLEYNSRLKFDIPETQLRHSFRRSLKKMDGGMVQISNQKVYLTNPGVQGFLDDALFNDGYYENLVKSVSSFSELRQLWHSKNIAPKDFLLKPEVWSERLHFVISTHSIDSSKLAFCIQMKTESALGKIGDNLLETAVLKYVNIAEEDISWDIHAMGKILGYMSPYNPSYSSENVVERYEAEVIKVIELECRSILEDQADDWDLETAISFTSEIVETVHCTTVMKSIGETIAESALGGAAEEFKGASGEDAAGVIDDIEALDSVYGLDATDVRYEIQRHADDQEAYNDMREEEYWEQQRDKLPKTERPAPPDVVEPSEKEIIDAMFKDI